MRVRFVTGPSESENRIEGQDQNNEQCPIIGARFTFTFLLLIEKPLVPIRDKRTMTLSNHKKIPYF